MIVLFAIICFHLGFLHHCHNAVNAFFLRAISLAHPWYIYIYETNMLTKLLQKFIIIAGESLFLAYFLAIKANHINEHQMKSIIQLIKNNAGTIVKYPL